MRPLFPGKCGPFALPIQQDQVLGFPQCPLLLPWPLRDDYNRPTASCEACKSGSDRMNVVIEVKLIAWLCGTLFGIFILRDLLIVCYPFPGHFHKMSKFLLIYCWSDENRWVARIVVGNVESHRVAFNQFLLLFYSIEK